MGMAHPEPRFHTAEMVRALLVEDRAWPRYETVHGELIVTPGPGHAHQWVTLEVAGELRTYLAREPVGVVLTSPADVSWGRQDVLVQPDVFVMPTAHARGALGEEGWTAVRHLLLAVEIVSPSSARVDRFRKRRLYQSQGVPTYWVIDAQRGEAEVWTPDAELPRVERERLAWHPEGAGEPFAFDLAGCLARLGRLRAGGAG